MKRDRNLSLEIKELIGSFFGLVIMLIGIYTPNFAYYFSGAFLMLAQVLHVAHPEIIKKVKAFYYKVRQSNIIDTFFQNIFWIFIHFIFSVLILLPCIYREITSLVFLICWILLVMFSIFIGILSLCLTSLNMSRETNKYFCNKSNFWRLIWIIFSTNYF